MHFLILIFVYLFLGVLESACGILASILRILSGDE